MWSHGVIDFWLGCFGGIVINDLFSLHLRSCATENKCSIFVVINLDILGYEWSQNLFYSFCDTWLQGVLSVLHFEFVVSTHRKIKKWCAMVRKSKSYEVLWKMSRVKSNSSMFGYTPKNEFLMSNGISYVVIESGICFSCNLSNT